MSASGALTLGKEERICSKKLIDKLFCGGDSHSLSAFPLRIVYLELDADVDGKSSDNHLQMLVSVPKRYFKRAVKRNRVKRQVREAYRHHCNILSDWLVSHPNRLLLVAFLWMDVKLYESAIINARVESLLERMEEKLCGH